MARTSQPSTSKPSRTPDARAKSNAAGYLKRRSTKAPALRVDDVYELVENEGGRRSKGKGKKPRRETLELEYDYGEDGAEGERPGVSDAEEDDGGKAPRLLGEGDTIQSDEDEEIDSDGAFEDLDGDADGFAGVFARKKAPTKKKQARPARFADVDLNEDADVAMGGSDAGSDAEEDLDSDTYIDILDVLDGKGEVYNEDSDGEPHAIPLRDPHPQPPADEEAGSDEDEDEDAVSEDEIDDPDDSDIDIDTSPEALTALHTLINGLPAGVSAKRKAAPDGDRDSAAPRKKRALAERTHAGAEGEFHVGSGTKLALADLLAPLASALPGVQKSLAPAPAPAASGATSAGKKAATGKKARAKAGGALAAPLPLRTQARVDREAAYEATKGEVDKWNPSMKRLREAEHLSFPLQAPPAQLGRPSSAALAASFIPRTELETSVARLLATAQLGGDADVQRTENTLMAATLDPAEVARRRAELRLQRELAFRGEAKARRVAKIKSRVYRKIARGRKARGEAGEEGAEDAEGERMRREVDRARERAGMRVRRGAGWRSARDEEDGDGEEGDEPMGGRRAMEKELERGERLARLIRGEDGDSAPSDSGDDDGEDGELDEGAVKRAAFDELRGLNEGAEEDAPQKGVFGMKFMRDGMARRAAEAGQMADDFVQEMGLGDGGSDEEGDGDDDFTSGVIIQRTGGRTVYRPGEPSASKAPDPKDTTTAVAGLPSPAPVSAPAPRPRPLLSSSAAAEATADVNPWLVHAGTSSGPKAPRAKNVVVVSKDSSAADKARHRLAKDETRLDTGKATAARDDGVVEIEMEKMLGAGEDEEDTNSEVDAQEAAVAAKKRGKGKGPKAFEQRDLVARAFAGDNVVREFEDAKRREIASDAPRVVDTTLPGWGSWGGPETRKASKPRPHLLKHIPGVAPAARADAGKAHLIISEKRDRKAAKYQVADLPYPFTSRAQYERSMEAPLGAEWNTRVGFQKGTLPRVVKKMGVVIEPLKKHL
ncbi:Utp14-domain-containing protein [Mycena belliarum]|uniref:Utp14-domain-containing protein n=1 Tax=Mycena belliarum TaxID=1033014 RepID=A0AAD6UDE5_9AGAR|nr:Utp14-domain-containing protein [Mycena belliae]